jgi:hypothetical protein
MDTTREKVKTRGSEMGQEEFEVDEAGRKKNKGRRDKMTGRGVSLANDKQEQGQRNTGHTPWRERSRKHEQWVLMHTYSYVPFI